MANVLVISPLLPATGNMSTVNRLKDHFTKNSVSAVFLCSEDLAKKKLPCSVNEINTVITEKQAKGIVLIHAVKSGFCVVCSCKKGCRVHVPYGIIFGGTDINEDVKDSVKFCVMKQCVGNALFYVAFNETMMFKACELFPNAQGYIQPQALDYALYDVCKCSNSDRFVHPLLLPCNNKPVIVFALPCSIRPVKDPLFLINEFFKLEKHFSKVANIRLLVIGPVTDSGYGMLFFDKLCANQNNVLDRDKFLASPYPIPTVHNNNASQCNDIKSWISNPDGNSLQFFPALPQEEYLSLLKDKAFFALLNTSISEGMASSLLEAMALGIPIIARDILGNKAIVQDHKTGILFSTPDEFVSKATELLNNPGLVDDIIAKARSYVLMQHNPYNEAKFYVSLIEQYFTPLPPSPQERTSSSSIESSKCC